MKSFLVAIFILCTLNSFAQSIGSGNAYQVDGNSYVRVDNFPPTSFPFTVSAWIHVADTNHAMNIITTDGHMSGYNGMWFQINPGMELTVNVGNSPGNGCFTQHCRNTIRGFIPKEFANKWIHVAATMTNTTTGALYVNGIQLVSRTDGFGNQTISASNGPVRSAYIGAFWGVTGNPDTPHNQFFGGIDEVRFWNVTKTDADIQDEMCRKLSGNEANLIAYFTFDENHSNLPVVNLANGNVSGITIGNTSPRKFSGARVGDISSPFYFGNQAVPGNEQCFHINNNGDTLALALNPNQFPAVQIYSVNSSPNHRHGIIDSCEIENYWGVFWVDLNNPLRNPEGSFHFRNPTPLQPNGAFLRGANNDTLWYSNPNVFDMGHYQVWRSENAEEIIAVCLDDTSIPDPETPNPVIPVDDPIFYIPNVFTPNADGINDLFTFEVVNAANYQMEIYNRWGQRLVTLTSPANSWDGRFNGNVVADGVYMGVVYGNDLNGNPFSKNFTVTVLK
ncbi:MAG: gliding motility-associated C-terminal domain-containing protein [Schleiferiaceae bacterium]|nr:gliding motility-associated C-terminal domain-containing protein [Schleiferiaceae bacterium]